MVASIETPTINAPVEAPRYITAADVARCSGKLVVCDTETTGLSWHQNHIIGIGIWCPQAEVYGYLPTLTPQEREQGIAAVKSWAPGTTWINHNLKFDAHFLGIDLLKTGWRWLDTIVMAHLLDSRQKKDLNSVARKYIGDETKEGYKVKGQKKMIWEWPLDLVATYCLNDCRITYKLAQTLVPQVKEQGTWALFTQTMQYIARLWQMERYGIHIDPERVAHSQQALGERVDALQEALYESCGNKFNWRSHPQLSKAIYEGLSISRPVNPFASPEDMADEIEILIERTFASVAQVFPPLVGKTSATPKAPTLDAAYEEDDLPF